MDISRNLPSGVEPSGIVFVQNTLYVVSDDGNIYEISGKGILRNTLTAAEGSDLESITTVPGRENYLYLAVESSEEEDGKPVILELNIESDSIERRFVVPSPFPASSGGGMEALTFIPIPALKNKGVFLAGSQDTGDIFILDIPLESSGENVDYIGKIESLNGKSDLSDMTVFNGNLYLVYDSDQEVDIFSLGTNLNVLQNGGKLSVDSSISLQHNNVEGVAFAAKCAFVAMDSGEVLRYTLADFLQ